MNPRVKMRGYGGAAIAVLTATVGWLMIQQPLMRDEIDEANTRTGQLEPQVQTLSDNQLKLLDGINEANRRLRAAGEPTVAVPTVAPTPPPVQPDEFTDDEAAAVRQIVTDLLSRQKVSITQAEISQISKAAATIAVQQIPKPNDGKTPTAAEMQLYAKLSVAAYCAGDRCRAPVATPIPGPAGKDGENGKDAPKITDEELLASVQAAFTSYCGLESKPCDGKTGPTGAPGEDAPPPWSVTDMDCIGDDTASYWRVYLSNGADQKTINEKGPCRVGPEPE
jgi:hypothetical protein